MKTLLALAALFSAITLHAAPIPLDLPKPDGKPGDATKPVKVYVLAGQSNMVGMGMITGARAPYPAVYLAADPAIIPGKMPAGTSRTKSACQWVWKNIPALERHGVYQTIDGEATGAIVDLHAGSFDPKKKPVKSTTMKLGQVAETIPTLDGPCTAVAKAFIEVPVSGTYQIHVGHGDSSHAIATINDTEVYRKEANGQPTLTKITLETGKRYPLQITYLKGGSAALWLEQIDLIGVGDLVTLTQKDGKFPYLLDDKGEWAARQDVFFQEARMGKVPGGPLKATSNGGTIGPEVGFGVVMGTFHDEQVLLIKTAIGNRSLKWDFRPPSSGRNDPGSEWEGLEYRLMIKGVRDTLAKIDQLVPGYKGQGYEIAGFGWFQGHKDSGSTKEQYEGLLVNLINDLRKDLDAPNMKAVIATVGFHGYRLSTLPWHGVWQAQMAVGDPKQHPEFAGNVATVDTRDFWREIEESPKGEDYHYNRNPESYLLVGEAMGRAMVRLLGGEAAEIPKSDREQKTIAAMAAEAAAPVPTAEQVAASNAAVKAMILDGLMPAFLADPRNQTALKVVLKPALPKPAKSPEYLDDAVDDAVAFLQAAGIQDHDWKPVLADMQSGTWDTFSFKIDNNPYRIPATTAVSQDDGDEDAEPAPAPKGKKAPAPPPLVIQFPTGMENWFAKDFDAKKAGWKNARAPFGKIVPKEWPENVAWIVKYPLYPAERPQPTTVVDNDVLLMRNTFDLPPAKANHRYRVRINGSINANSGEGFAIYANGKLMSERKNGVTGWRKQGISGSHVWTEFMEDFKGGPLTLAIANFPMSNYKPGADLPAVGPLSVTIEEQKLPELGTTP